MKKMRKGKKMLLILLITLLVALVALIVVFFVKKGTEKPEIPEEKPIVIPLPETTYSDMQVKNIQMEYLKDNNETMITFQIHNTTNSKVESQFFDAALIGPDDNVLTQMPNTYIQSLDVGEIHEVSVVYKGDLTSTTQIKLIKK